ncbi:DUF599 domain-containing protein [Methyloraptor flagellatus]|uniref:DUF599 family protein n=1 Tax=Methyloraptor flagellatus TaxID=3162530 RepID=A0AAU7XCZ5_9HYPH
MPIPIFPDAFALAWFIFAWFGVGYLVDKTSLGDRSLSRRMDMHRRVWAARMLERDVRIVDTAIMSSLQNGTAFFASTSLIAVGAAFGLLNQADRLLEILSEIPLHVATSRMALQTKALGLVVIYGYAFFKFGWSYRLFNYAAILIGAVPNASDDHDPAQGVVAARRFSEMQIDAGHHFHWGLRALFFSLGFMGWLVNAWIFMATTTVILLVLLRRQYLSHALHSLEDGPDPLMPPPRGQNPETGITAPGTRRRTAPPSDRRQAL